MANQLANVIVVLDGLVVSMNRSVMSSEYVIIVILILFSHRLINSQLDMDILREVIQAFENFVINVCHPLHQPVPSTTHTHPSLSFSSGSGADNW